MARAVYSRPSTPPLKSSAQGMKKRHGSTAATTKIGALRCLLLLLFSVQVLAQTDAFDATHAPQATSSREDDSARRLAEGQALYGQAVQLLDHIRVQSVSVTYQPPTSLFRPDSYTLLLDLVEAADGPLASAVRFLRKCFVGHNSKRNFASAAPAEEEEEDNSWSILRFLSKLTGGAHHQLLGDYYAPASDQSTADAAQSSRTKRILDNLSAGATLSKAEVKSSLEKVSDLLHRAGDLGCDHAWPLMADLNFWGKHGKQQNFTLAHTAYKSWADRTGSPEAQYMVGFLKGTGLGDEAISEPDQAAALLYYTFAALGGAPEAEITTGYRHWVGIGTPQSCPDALSYYKSAADKAMSRFYSGPPGGKHLPPHKLRLSDLEGGVYGAGASAASTGLNAYKAATTYYSATGNIHNPTTEAEWDDVLEYYTFHADRGSADFMYRLARIYYQGFGTAGAVSSARRAQLLAQPPNGHTHGHRAHGLDETGGRDFAKALKWFSRIARAVWPRDAAAALKKGKDGHTIATYDIARDPKATKDEHLAMVGGLAAGYLGKMHLRGEGVAQDFDKAFLWFSRGLAQGDHQCQNGLGLMFRDGLGVHRDLNKAFAYFKAAAAENLVEAQINLARLYYDSGDKQVASQYFEVALRNNDPIQALYYLAEINAHAVARPDLCPVSVAFYKMVVERGDWEHEVWWDAERAWAAGDKHKALLGFWVMAERGYEQAQNNVAYILDKEKSLFNLPAALRLFGGAAVDSLASHNNSSSDRLALTYWTRSAAQDNVDALVKMGDYYLNGVGTPSGRPQTSKAAACYQSAASTHVSALSMWNLGWMHETGVGVKKDFHLAKRYYDLALQTNSEAYLPVTLSLLKLHIRSVYEALTSGSPGSLTLQSPFAAPAEDGTVAIAKPRKARLRDAVAKIFTLRFHEGLAELFAGIPSGHRDLDPATAQEIEADDLRQRQRALEAEDDPVRWAREAREREGYDLDEEGEESWESLGLGGRDSDVLESIGIVGIIAAVGFLLYYRGLRAEAARQANEARRRQEELDRQQQQRQRQNEAQ